MTLTLILVGLPLSYQLIDDSAQAPVNLIDKRADGLPSRKIKVFLNVRLGIEDDSLDSRWIYVDLNHRAPYIKTRGDDF